MGEKAQDSAAPLAAAIGGVALADAKADEWLMQLLHVLLWPQPPDAVRVLVARDSASFKIDKIVDLLELSGFGEKRIEGWDDLPKKVLRELKKVKEDRDRAVHSFYEDPSDLEGPIRRYRSRSSGISMITVEQLVELRGQISRYTAYLEAITSAIEDRRAHEQALEGDRMAMLEDCRELLVATPLRLPDDKLAVLRSAQLIRIALSGQGRWRGLQPEESPLEGEALAVLNPANGSIAITTADGESINGGDTGWRDVTDLARADEPEVERALLRRMHGQVSVVQAGGNLLHRIADGAVARSLEARAFGPTDQQDLPGWINQLEGFRPSPPE